MQLIQRHLRLAALLPLLVLTACGGGDQPSVETDPSTIESLDGKGRWDADGCTPLPLGPTRAGGDLVLALGEAVDPAHAPVPVTAAERTVFANCYETLTRVTCEGVVQPGLAEQWERLDDGRRWRLTLREGAVFWDGTPVTSRNVVQSWSRNGNLALATGLPGPDLWLAPGGRGLVVQSARILEIHLGEPQDDLPSLLAHPALAIATLRQGWLWPVGSGPCRLAADTTQPIPDLVCRPNLHHPEYPTWASLTFRILPGADDRDLLNDADLAVIRNRHAAAYYQEIEGVQSGPLPFDRLYVLLVPPRSGLDTKAAFQANHGTVTPAESRDTRSLDFHGCRPLSCPQLHGPTLGLSSPLLDPDPALNALVERRLVFAANDPDALALAERVDAFLEANLELHAAKGLDLGRDLLNGRAAAYVVKLEAQYPTACLTMASLLARADWLQQRVSQEIDACAASKELARDGLVVPLVQTRQRLVWRGPLVGLRLAHDGALLVDGLGPAKEEITP